MAKPAETNRPDRRRLVAVVAVVLALVLTTVLALTREPVNRALSDQIEQRLGLSTVRADGASRESDLQKEVADREDQIAERDARIDALAEQISALEDRLSLETERANALSSALAGERGIALGNVETMIATRAAIVDRVAKRRAIAENQARGAALPWFGTGAIASTLRKRQAEDCALLRDLDQLEQAITGDAPGSDATEAACAATAPTAEALWAAVRNDPLAGWNAMRKAGHDLPDIAVEGPLGFLLDTIDGMGAWLQPGEPQD